MKNILCTRTGAMVTPFVLSLVVASCVTTSSPMTLEPGSLDGLTCEAYDFKVVEAPKALTWSIDPADAAHGQIDANGHYTAPMVVPAESFSVVAQADGSEARSQVTLHTAHPVEIGKTALVIHDIEQRAVAAFGTRVYAAGLDANNGIMVARSDDGGKTFVAAVAAGNMPSGIKTGCVSVAIDAGNADVVYVTYQAMDNGGAFAKTTDVNNMSAGSTIALAVSEDKGATFTNYVLVSQNNEGYCSDLASTSPDTIAVIVPTDDGDMGTGDSLHVYTYVDTLRGKGFSAGKIEAQAAYRVDEQFTPFFGQPITKISSTGGTDGLESPAFFTNQKGMLCAVYWSDNQTLPHKYPIQVECSKDGGKTFSTPVTVLDTATKGDGSIIPLRPRGAVSDDGKLAVIWGESDENVYVSTSPDGAAWSAPVQINKLSLVGTNVKGHHPTIAWEGGVLWVAYQVNSGGADDAIVVDKSCDGGTTWSGNQIINEMGGAVVDRKYPALHLTANGPVVSASSASEDANLAFTTLKP